MRDSTKETLYHIQKVIAEYTQKVTIRQIYYRLVADYGYENSLNSYKRIGKVLADARLNGIISFDAIEDRTRPIGMFDWWEYQTVGQFMDAQYKKMEELDKYYGIPKWYNQPKKVVVMVEKQALQGVFENICSPWQVDLMVCKGYPSLTQQYELAERMRDKLQTFADLDSEYGETIEQELHIIYFGDFDPSGENIPEKMEERLVQDFDLYFESFTKEALTMAQVDAWGLPPAPAKETDSRTQGFIRKYGVGMQVELDAIKPNQLSKMINDAIARHYDAVIGMKRDELTLDRRRKIREIVEKMDIPGLRKLADEEDDDDE